MDTKTFADLGLSPKVQAAITAAGYPSPTPIQAAVSAVGLAIATAVVWRMADRHGIARLTGPAR